MSDLTKQIADLRKQGLILPRNHNEAVRMASGMVDVNSQLKGDLARHDAAGSMPYRGSAPGRGMRHGGFMKHGTASDVAMAIPRFYDPLEYWDLSGLPWNMADEGHRHKLHKWMRLFYMTHYLVPILIDIFTRFPLSGLEMYSPDPEIERFYTRVFLEDLKYEDFLVNLGREYWLCALPGEMVRTPFGVKPIEEVAVGEQVLTHRGRYRPVTRTTSKHYGGQYVELKPHYGEPIKFTTGHEVLVRRDGSEPAWCVIEDVRTSDEVFVPVDNTSTDVDVVSVWDTLKGWLAFPSEDDIDAIVSIPENVSWAKSVVKYRSWLKRQLRDLDTQPGDVWKRDAKWAQHSPLPANFGVDDDLLWFLGLYLAEGSVSKDGVRISLHKGETDYAQRVVDFAASHGINATVRPCGDTKGVNVSLYSISLGAWIESLMGTGASKRLPDWIMQLPAKKTSTLLRGYFDGDGHYGQTRVHAAARNHQIALQVEQLIRRLGVVTTINECNSVKNGTECKWWMVGPCMADTNLFLETIGLEPTHPQRKRAFAEWDTSGDYSGYWVKVHKTKTDDYEGQVYDLTVEEDHSFASSIAVHNCGEAFALGQFNEDLGVWDQEELVNPESIVIENFPLLNERQLKVTPPEDLVRLAQTKQPSQIYKTLADNFPDFIPYLLRNEPFPVSDVLLKQVAFKTSTWDDHGTPILLRGLRTLIHEEKLLASQDAIAERLYSPLILAKLGYPPTQQSQGFLPGPEQLEAFRDDLDMALSSDFRMMAYHYALEIETVFGRESVPDLGGDFDRIERRLMQIFGINPSLLAGGASGDPYASSALHAEFMNQMLRTFQKYLKEHFRERALVVAEANGHYEYEKRGQTRVPVMERVVEYDDDGSMHVRERPKLMVPELQMQVLDMRDEATERQFLQSLRQMGVPISDERLMVGVSFEYKDSLDEMMEERVQVTVAQQSAKLRTYKALKQQGLPIPPALKAEVESPDEAGAGGPGGPPPPGGGPLGGPPPGGGGAMDADMMPPPGGDLGPGGFGGAPPGGGPPPASPLGTDELSKAAPAVSSERRPGMPTAASVDSQIEDATELIDKLERSKRDRRGRAASTAPQPLTRVEEGGRIIESGVLPLDLRKQHGTLDPLVDLDFDLS